MPDTSLSNDLANGTVPNFAFIVPDQCHDKPGVTGTCVDPQLSTQTDAYLQSTVNLILNSAAWQNGTSAIVIDWDEGSTTLGCCDADRLAKRSYDLILVARDETRLNALAARLTSETGRSVTPLPASIVMSPEDMVDAALVGLDQGELVTIPGLHDGDEWTRFEAVRRALAQRFGNSKPAPRYLTSALA